LKLQGTIEEYDEGDISELVDDWTA